MTSQTTRRGAAARWVLLAATGATALAACATDATTPAGPARTGGAATDTVTPTTTGLTTPGATTSGPLTTATTVAPTTGATPGGAPTSVVPTGSFTTVATPTAGASGGAVGKPITIDGGTLTFTSCVRSGAGFTFKGTLASRLSKVDHFILDVGIVDAKGAHVGGGSFDATVKAKQTASFTGAGDPDTAGAFGTAPYRCTVEGTMRESESEGG